MTTDVHEPAEDTVRSAHDCDRDVADVRGEVRPRLLDPLRGPGVRPGALEDPLALERVDVRRRSTSSPEASSRPRAAARCVGRISSRPLPVATLLLTVLSVRILRMPGTEQATPSSAATSRVDEILRAACRVVVSGGASDLRIGTVAQEAGVSRTLVHYYFTTRQELLRAAIVYAENRRVEALEVELATLETGAERAERALLRTIEPELEETPALWNEVWSSLCYDAELRPLVQERYRAWAERIVRLLDEGREDGSVPRCGRSDRRGLAARGGGRRARLDRLPRSARSRGGERAARVVRPAGARSRDDGAPLAVRRARRDQQVLRRRRRRRRRLARDRKRRVLLAPRPVRLRQDDDAAHDRRLRAPGRGADRHRRHGRHADSAAPSRR